MVETGDIVDYKAARFIENIGGEVDYDQTISCPNKIHCGATQENRCTGECRTYIVVSVSPLQLFLEGQKQNV
jgi:hypothetical protein